MDLLFFYTFILIIQTIKSLLKVENIASYSEKSFSLNSLDFSKIYTFYPKITDIDHEIILQISSNYNGNAFLCTNYFRNKFEENIYYNSMNNEFINCQKTFNIKTIENIEEYNITYNFNNSTNLAEIDGYYLIILYINKKDNQEFTGTLTLFTTNMNVIIDKYIQNKYLIYKNNYSTKNYSFLIFPSNKITNKSLHIQISTLNNRNLFNLQFSNDNNYLIDEKTNIASYNNFFDILNKDDNYYNLNISFLEEKSDLDNPIFAIYFEYSSHMNNLSENSNEINFLIKSEYYFYQNINEKNKLFYLANDNLLKRGTVTLSFIPIKNDELKNFNNNTYLENQIYSLNFINCKNRLYGNSLTVFKCELNMNLKNNTNFILLKISGSGIFPLKIRKIEFKELNKIIVEENEYKDDIFYKSFNSKNIMDKLGYIHIPILNDNTKNKLVYCSLSNTMNIFSGDYDIIDSNLDNSYLDKLKIFKISYEDNPDGFTIISFNKDSNYFIQVIDIDKEIYDNLLIEKKTDKDKLNKEITFDIPIKNYYIFFINEYNEDFQDIIFDAQIHYGIIDIKYIDIDLIPENNFNLNNVLHCNDKNYQIIDANHPFIVKPTTEFIRITNLNYHSNYFYEAKFYLNKYLNKENKKFNTLIPIYLNPLESKIFSLDIIFGNIKYFFKLGDNYNDYTENKQETLVNIIIGNNNLYNLFNLTLNNSLIKGNLTNVNFGEAIKFINHFNKSILIWTNLGSLSDLQENIRTLYLSKNFYYLYTFSLAHKLCFDWFNIKKKINYGIIPQKILISLLNEKQTKTNGYYYEILTFEDNNDDDYLFYYSTINSLNYELKQGESHIFLSGDINITIFDYYYKEKSYINYMIYPLSGLATIIFYVEYLYDLTPYSNYLKFLDFDDSIYSINLKLNNTYISYRYNYDNYKYIVFQCLSCKNIQSKISFKYNNISYSQDNNYGNNIIFKSVSSGNTIGYVNLGFFNENTLNDEIFINIIKPYQIYIKYYYAFDINNTYIFQNNYNINVEKEQNNGNNKNIFIISFDCFLKNIKTNYTILILNKTETKNEITNECEFFSYIQNMNDTKKYFSFIDNNENIRIKKEISFEKFGNYAIYILAQSLNSLSIFKFLGVESYTYTDIIYQNTRNQKEESKIQEIIAILIFIILIIILIILFIVFRHIRKRKIIQLYNSLNSSFLSQDILSTKNTSTKISNVNDLNYIDITNSIDVEENNNNYEKNKFILFEKPKNENVKINNNLEENHDKNGDNKDLEPDPSLLCQSPAPLLGNTFLSEEDKIRNELAKINSKSNSENNIDEEKKYINTNNGNG